MVREYAISRVSQTQRQCLIVVRLFVDKKILIPFDDGFNLTDASLLSGSAKSKSMGAIWHSLDSLNHYYDSVGNVNF